MTKKNSSKEQFEKFIMEKNDHYNFKLDFYKFKREVAEYAAMSMVSLVELCNWSGEFDICNSNDLVNYKNCLELFYK